MESRCERLSGLPPPAFRYRRGVDLTVADVEKRVAKIRAMSDDDESAHGMEDGLRGDVLRAIAKGASNPHLLAAAALKTDEIDFARWCA